jgi:AraC-like DNA-binding protein
MKTVSNRLLQDWLHITKNKGHNLKALLSASGIPWRCYENTRSHISGEQLARLNAEIRRQLDDQFMGYGRDVMAPALLDRVMIKILAQARNLKELLSEWESFWNLVQRGTGVTSTGVDKNDFVYRFQFNTSQRPGTYVWILDSTMLKLQLFSWMIGKPIKPKVIGIAEPAPAGVSDDLTLLPARVLFSQSQNFFIIDENYLHYPVVRTVEQCLDYKKYLPRDFFAIPDEKSSFAGLVERTMRNILRAEFRLPQIDCIAQELSVSARGLNRKLEAEGEGFQKLKNRIRRELALEKLDCPDVAIRDIAADLGFSGTAAFSRAFKTWTARTPQEYRTRSTAPSR